MSGSGEETLGGWTTLICTLTCGCAFHVHAPTPEAHILRDRHKLGGWYGCMIHSPVVRYDPTTGDPDKYDRDQQLMSVAEVPS